MNIVKNILHPLLESLHLIIFLIPILYLFGILKNQLFFQIILAIILITPLHWTFFDNKCILTLFSNKLSNNKEYTKYVDNNFYFIYKYLKKAHNIKMSEKEFNEKLLGIFISTMLIISWYVIFYKMECNLIKKDIKKKNFFL